MVILFDVFHMPDDVFSLVFATEQQVQVAKLFFNEIKGHGGSLDKTQMSVFANTLHDGMMIETEISIGPIKKKDRVKLSYNKRQFYDRILTPMRAMGMIDYDLYKKKYIVSHKFVDELNKIGMLWRKETSGSIGY
ncbi:TPA: hypothetical protein HA219_02455 [Candidatus Woesearchaeota archaeon]|nr:hypothetical protein [Candidatus Woesearchaeota archaeon]